MLNSLTQVYRKRRLLILAVAAKQFLFLFFCKARMLSQMKRFFPFIAMRQPNWMETGARGRLRGVLARAYVPEGHGAVVVAEHHRRLRRRGAGDRAAARHRPHLSRLRVPAKDTIE